MVWIIVLVLVALWLAALVFSAGNPTAHILAVVVVLLLLYQWLKRRGPAV